MNIINTYNYIYYMEKKILTIGSYWLKPEEFKQKEITYNYKFNKMEKSKKIVLIFDPPHGEETPGKRSPDGLHREWKWGRERLKELEVLAKACGFRVEWTTKGNSEIGLSQRVKNAENIKVDKGQIKLLISLHNNAAGDGTQWMAARGFEVWTNTSIDKADEYADLLFPIYKKRFPDNKIRLNKNKALEQDKEKNFTVLTGKKYVSLLLEYLFQDNKEDIQILSNEIENKKLEDCLMDWIEIIEEFEQARN